MSDTATAAGCAVTPEAAPAARQGKRPRAEGDAARARGSVLVVDDDHHAREALVELLQDEGYATTGLADGRHALSALESLQPDVILTDLRMPRMGGLELLDKSRARAPNATFLVMTAFGSIATAVEAMQRGADDYLTKPLEPSIVSALVARAVDKAQLSHEAASLRSHLQARQTAPQLVGEHPSMQRLLATVKQVAQSRATVLIQGESGTGKELVAAALHHHSPRREGPFVRLNCAALADGLLESELFGHERGSFTGATARRAGRFEQAHGGTLFLDEISEVSSAVQVKLLRFLQERELERVGGNTTICVDVRVVAATHRDLAAQVRAGAFREDLYYRLNVVQLDVPPLRARASDIPHLARHFLARHAAENGRVLRDFDADALEALQRHAWPGNVRELQNAMERAAVLCERGPVGVGHLPDLRPEPTDAALRVPGVTLGELERMAIVQALEAADGSTARAAELLGVSQRKIQYRLREWGAGPSTRRD